MSDMTTPASAAAPGTEGGGADQLRDINEALLIAAVRQHELADRAEKAEAELKASMLSLAEQDRRKDEFMAMLSHELRNPLASLHTAARILHLHASPTETAIQHQARLVIERQVGTLSRLVDDLMEVSRMVSGKIRLVRVSVDLCDAVRHALDTVAPALEQRQHQLSVTVPESPVWVTADETRLEQIIVNLFHNAAKFTDQGGRIGVSVAVHNQQAELRVRDSGIGIAPDMLGHIFDLFAQADRSLARSDGGLGIGLSLVQRLVALHGGTVEAVSGGLGQGSEFIVRLPLVAPPAVDADRDAGAVGAPGSRRLRVLVVDDNCDGCAMLAAFVKLLGHTVDTAASGPEALAVATTWRPDVVLLDIGLPGLTGFEVARTLRETPGHRAMTLVAVTGYGGESDVARGRECGFDRHLVKPIDLSALERLLATLCLNVEKAPDSA